MTQFFKDLKVLELASVLAGPAVGMFFAELGAEVIKIENLKSGGDVTRTWRLADEDPEGVSAYYASVNFNKKVIFLDLSTKKGQNKVYELLTDTDIILTNFKKDTAKKLSMDYETLRTHKPDLIYGHLTGFGIDSSRPAFDMVLQAEAGFLSMTGEQGGRPVKMPVALLDVLAAHQMKEGILMALLKKMKTGQGSFVTVSLYHAALASLANQATNWLMAKHIPQAIGCQHPNIAPYGSIYLTKDQKPVVIACGSQQHFIDLCQYFSLDHLLSDERFSDNTHRVANRAVLDEYLVEVFGQKDRAVLMNELTNLQVPIGAIKNMQEVFEDEASHAVILEEMQQNTVTRRVKTAVFEID